MKCYFRNGNKEKILTFISKSIKVVIYSQPIPDVPIVGKGPICSQCIKHHRIIKVIGQYGNLENKHRDNIR